MLLLLQKAVVDVVVGHYCVIVSNDLQNMQNIYIKIYIYIYSTVIRTMPDRPLHAYNVEWYRLGWTGIVCIVCIV